MKTRANFESRLFNPAHELQGSAGDEPMNMHMATFHHGNGNAYTDSTMSTVHGNNKDGRNDGKGRLRRSFTFIQKIKINFLCCVIASCILNFDATSHNSSNMDFFSFSEVTMQEAITPQTYTFPKQDTPPVVLPESNMSFIWNADVSRETRSHNLASINETIKVTIVVAHCRESLEWLTKQLLLTRSVDPKIVVESIHVYSKCGEVPEGMYSVANKTQTIMTYSLPNYGGNDHTFAHWMSHHFDTLLQNGHHPYDVVVFVKDNMYRLNWKFIRSFTLEHLVGNAITNGFSCLQETPFLGKRQKKRCVSAYHSLESWRTFRLSDYVRQGDDPNLDGNSSSQFRNTKYRMLGDWIDDLSLNLSGVSHPQADGHNPRRLLPILPVCYGGQFAVTRGQLRAAQSKLVYQRIASSLARDNAIEEGHYAERTWAALLSKPLCNAALNTFLAEASSAIRRQTKIQQSRPGVIQVKMMSSFHCDIDEDIIQT